MTPQARSKGLNAGRRWWLARLAVAILNIIFADLAYPASPATELWRAALIGLATAIVMDLIRWGWRQAGRE